MQKGKGTIFINYRKDDSNWNALALYQELQKYFSKEQIFKDFNAISPGDDFVVSINTALQACDVLLVVIGKSWINIKSDAGERRLDDPHDFVRLEIAKALDRNIKVVPVLFDRAPMPKVTELPENLQGLCRRQFVEIDPTGFEDDVRKLADAIRNVMKDSGYTDIPNQQSRQQQSQSQPEQPFQPQRQQAQHTQSQHFTDRPVVIPRKPDNNLVWGILTTILCCLPLGIMSIISSSKVDGLYNEGRYPEAQAAADQAKKYATWAVIAGVIVIIIYVMLMAVAGSSGY